MIKYCLVVFVDKYFKLKVQDDLVLETKTWLESCLLETMESNQSIVTVCDRLWELNLVTDQLYVGISKVFHFTEEWVYWMLIPALFYSSNQSSSLHLLYNVYFNSLIVVCTHPT